MSTGLASPEAPVVGVHPPCLLTSPLPLCIVCIVISYENTSQIGLGPHHMTSVPLDHMISSKSLSPNTVSLEVLGVGTSTYE